MTDKLLLKSCPFCGAPGLAHLHHEMPDSYIAGCSDDDCIGHQVAFDFVSQEAAIAAWNRRTPTHPPSGVETVGALELGRAFYLAMYEEDGANWDAVDERYRPIWIAKAQRFAALTPPLLVGVGGSRASVAESARTGTLPVLTDTPCQSERDPTKLPARELTADELDAEQARIEKLWDEMFEPDPETGEEFEGHSGSPGEWMAERLGEIAHERAHRPLRARKSEGGAS